MSTREIRDQVDALTTWHSLWCHPVGGGLELRVARQRPRRRSASPWFRVFVCQPGVRTVEEQLARSPDAAARKARAMLGRHAAASVTVVG